MKKNKKPLIITAIVLGSLIILAVLAGIFNALFANGEWNFGWSDYRYDETGYQIGSGSVPSSALTSVSVDWIDGEITVVLCEDANISMTETSDMALTEDSLLRWRVSEDGTHLSVKYRKSSWFFGTSENKDKDLILRIPKKIIPNLQSLQIHGVSTEIEMEGMSLMSLDVKTVSGDISLYDMTLDSLVADTVSGEIEVGGSIRSSLRCDLVSGEVYVKSRTTPTNVQINSVSGDIELVLPESPVFSLQYNTVSGKIDLGYPCQQQDNRYLCGEGSERAKLSVNTTSGRLSIHS